MANKNPNSFSFFTPLTISKSQDESGKAVMKLAGIASTMDVDSDGEFLDPEGFDVTYLMKSGVVNWHHGAKTNPETIIGEPTKAKLDKKGLYLESTLYNESNLARKVYDLAGVLEKNSKTRRLGMSIEGKVLERDTLNPKIIKKASITGIAITHMPKNAKTFVNIIKGDIGDDGEGSEKEISLEEINKSLEEELQKAKIALADEILKASSCDSLDKTEKTSDDEEDEEDDTKEKSLSTDSGRALIKEHVDGKEKNITKAQIFDAIFEKYPQIELEKARKIFDLISKISEMKTKIKEEDIEKAFSLIDNISKGTALVNSIDATGETKESDEEEEDEEEEDDESGQKKVEKGEKITFAKVGSNLYREALIKGEEIEILEDSLDYEKDSDGNFVLKAFGEDEDDLEKGDEAEEIEDAPKRLFSKDKEIMKAITNLQDSNKKLADSFLTISKAKDEEIESLREDLNRVLEKGEGRRSFKSVKEIERNFDGIEKGGSPEGGSDGKVVSIGSQKGKVADLLEKAAFAPIARGEQTPDSFFSKALTSFEVTGQLSKEARQKLEVIENIVLAD